MKSPNLKPFSVSLLFLALTCFLLLCWALSSDGKVADFFINNSLLVLLGVIIVGIFLLFYHFLLLINRAATIYVFLINAAITISTGLIMFVFFIHKINPHG